MNYSDGPHAGHYKTRLVRKGPWVAVRVWLDDDRHEPGNPDNALDRSPIWRVELDGREVELSKVSWPFCQPIDRAEYRFLLANARHARQHRPDSPEASPTEAVDLSNMRPIF